MSIRSVTMGANRATPLSSTDAIAAPSGELIRICSGRLASPPDATRTISPTEVFPGQDSRSTGRSPATHAVVRSPSVRLRGLRFVPSRAVESAPTTILSRLPVSSNSRSSSSLPGTGRAVARTVWSPGPTAVNSRCRPTSAGATDRPPGSLPRLSEYAAGPVVPLGASVGRRSIRVTCTPGTETSENPAPVSPGRPCWDARIVTFSQVASPSGAATRWVPPSGRSGLTRLPRSVSTRTTVGAARTSPLGSGVRSRDPGIAVGPVKAIRSHSPRGEPGDPSAQAVSGLPSKALTGSYWGRWKSQLPTEEAVTDSAPRRTAVVWWRSPETGRIWRGSAPGSWTADSALRSSTAYVWDVPEFTRPNRVSARRSPSPAA